jgi:hypothetical protein
MADRGSTQQRKQSFEDHHDDGFVDEVNDVGLHPLSKLIGKESDSHFNYSPLPRKGQLCFASLGLNMVSNFSNVKKSAI